MKSRTRTTTRPLTLAFAALIVLAAGHSSARADEVFIEGFNFGCFGVECAPIANSTFLGLSFSSSRFSGTTVGGFRGIGSNANPGSNVNNFGSFTLSSVPQAYNTPFTLFFVFTSPQGVLTPEILYRATITGNVITNNLGGVFIDFSDIPGVVLFFDRNCEPDPTGGIPGQQTTCGLGSFRVTINDVAINPGSTVPLTGQFTRAAQGNPFPEPATLLLLGTGISGLAARLGWRRKQVKNKLSNE